MSEKEWKGIEVPCKLTVSEDKIFIETIKRELFYLVEKKYKVIWFFWKLIKCLIDNKAEKFDILPKSKIIEPK